MKIYTLDELLTQCDPDVLPAEIDWGPDVGLERLDYLPELLAQVDPDEIGWDWDPGAPKHHKEPDGMVIGQPFTGTRSPRMEFPGPGLATQTIHRPNPR